MKNHDDNNDPQGYPWGNFTSTLPEFFLVCAYPLLPTTARKITQKQKKKRNGDEIDH
jgi:hypothetical protein